MKKAAEAHEAEDKKKRDEVDTRNQADAMAYSAEKTLKDAGDKVDAPTKEKVEKAIAETRKSLGRERRGRDQESVRKLAKGSLRNVRQDLQGSRPNSWDGSSSTGPGTGTNG